MALNAIQVGGTLHVFDEANSAKVDELVEKSMNNGEAKYFPDGSTEWIDFHPICDYNKSGSGVYTWDRSGNRIKCEKRRYSKDKDGKVSHVVEKITYRSPD